MARACPTCGAPPSAWTRGAAASGPPPLPPRPGAPAAPHPGRSHGWEGKLYVVLNYLGAAMFAFSGILFLLLPLTSDARTRATAQPGMIFLSFGAMVALCIACARGVRGFRAWGWWLATLISAFALLTCVAVLFVPTGSDPASTRLGAFVFIAFHAVFLRYFLARRRDFGVGV